MFSKTLIAASTRPLILAILSRGEDYGFNIIQRVKTLSGGSLEWTDGMLYPVLQRMEMDGHVASAWRMQEGQRPRRYYTLTERGRRELAKELGLEPEERRIPIEEWKGKNLLFIAGGIALPPMRCLIWNCLDRRDWFKDVTILYGARMARGCTSGQALSGGATLSAGSWVVMFAIFGGAYGVAYFVRKLWN